MIEFILLGWSVSALIMRKKVFEEDVLLWVSLLRLVLAPLLLIFVILEWIEISIKSALRD